MGQAAEDLVEGFVCSYCGIYFSDVHGVPVICEECWKKRGKGKHPAKAWLPELGDEEDHLAAVKP